MTNPPRPFRLYLCHADTDKPAVRQLYQYLTGNGITVWFDEEDLLPGSDKNLAIAKAIKAAQVILVCLSQKAVNTPGYIHKELKLALDKADEQPEGAITIIPVRLDVCELPSRLEKLVAINFFEEGGRERLLKNLRKIAELNGLVAPAPITTQREIASATATSPANPTRQFEQSTQLGLRNQLLEFLASLSVVGTSNQREAFISYLGLGRLRAQLDTEGAPFVFSNSLITIVAQEGQTSLATFISSLATSPFIGGLENQQFLTKLHVRIISLSEAEFRHDFRPSGTGNSSGHAAPAASPSAANPASQISVPEQFEIVKLLLACPTISNSGARETLISNLPSQIANSINRAHQATATMEVMNLLKACLAYPDGLKNLLTVLNFFEQDSIPFRALDNYIKKYLP